MRPDMHDVLTERPRFDSRRRHPQRRAQRRWDEDSPTRQPMNGTWRGTREFNDVLGPLRGLLKSRCGQPWDKVYSEICAQLDCRSFRRAHLMFHLRFEIDFDVEIVGREIRTVPNGALVFSHGRNPAFYVHPRTGLLLMAPYKYAKGRRGRGSGSGSGSG